MGGLRDHPTRRSRPFCWVRYAAALVIPWWIDYDAGKVSETAGGNRPYLISEAMFINRTAWIALVCIIVLVLVGATVRVTGSGLGCPDWPFCWGCIIPPTSVDQIDVEKIDIAKYKRRAVRRGIDPDTITKETVLASFNPVHTWIEFVNRLTSLPLGLSTLVLAISSVLGDAPSWVGDRIVMVLFD